MIELHNIFWGFVQRSRLKTGLCDLCGLSNNMTSPPVFSLGKYVAHYLFLKNTEARPICFLRVTGLQIFQDEEGCIPAWTKSMVSVY